MWEPWYWLSWDAMLWWHFDHFKTHQNPPDMSTVWMQACWRLPGLDLSHLSTDLGHLPNRESLVALTVKTPPVMQETWVQFLGQEDPLEKEMATHSSLLTWRIPWTEEPSGLQSIELQIVRHDWAHMRVISRNQQKDFPQTLSEWSMVEAECHCYCLYFKWEFLLCWSNKESLGIQDLFLNSQAHVLKPKSYSFFPYKGTSVDMFITGPCYE